MDNFCFCLWYGPQYRFAFGRTTQQQIHVTWLEKLSLCDLKYTNINAMFRDVAKHQGFDGIEGLAMTIISDEFYDESLRLKHKQLMAERANE